MVELASWLTALPVLLAAAALTWAVSVMQRNVTIVDTLWPVLFILAAVTYAGSGARRTEGVAAGRTGGTVGSATRDLPGLA